MSHGSVFPSWGRERQNSQKILFSASKPHTSPQIKQQLNQNKSYPQGISSTNLSAHPRQRHTQGHNPIHGQASFSRRPDNIPSFHWCPLPSRKGRHSQGMAFLGNGTPNGGHSLGMAFPVDSPAPSPRSGRSGCREQRPEAAGPR